MDERDKMTAEEVAALNISVEPMALMLLKVCKLHLGNLTHK